ncbi:MAG: hypothetical protein IJN16_07245 [Lachnospiraceae bacterium]|nr:hypothetical protein [Lachnospiraceae bacterium]
MSKLVYKPLEPLSKLEIQEQLERGEEEELLLLPLSVGEYGESWKDAQDVCLRCMEHNNPAIRANAALGLAYIARNHRMLDKRIVKPYLLKELRENREFEWRIKDAISDINMFMGWNLASKHGIDS